MVTTPPITAAGILINGTGPMWTPRIVDAAVAQALAEAGLHDLGHPIPNTSTCRTAAAFAEMQSEPVYIPNEHIK